MAAWGLLFGVAAVQANGNVDAGAPWDTVAPPWETDAITSLTDDPFSTDRSFNGGQYIEDAFFANQTLPTNFFEGRAVVRLGNGDLAVAALVKNPNGNQTNGNWNIGLVRYNPAGTQRVPWPNGGIYAHAGGEYVVYPKADGANFSEIRDIKAINGKILVATNLKYGGTDDIDTQILVFSDSGAFLDNQPAFNDSSVAETVGGMAVLRVDGDSRDQVVVVATRATRPSLGSGMGRPVFRRYALEASGALTDVTGVVGLNTNACSDTATECHATGIAIGGRAEAKIYVSYAYRPNTSTQNWDIVVSQITANGSLSSNWRGAPSNPISDGGNLRDWPVDIAVRTTGVGTPVAYIDEIVVVAESSRNCQGGIGVLKIGQDGISTAARVIGGDNSTGFCILGNPTEYPKAIAFSRSRIAVAGYSVTPPFLIGGEARVDSSLAILENITLRDLRDYTFPIYGPRIRHSRLWDIVDTTDGRFVAVGDNRFRNASDVPATLRGKTSVAVLGLAADRLFGDGFGN